MDKKFLRFLLSLFYVLTIAVIIFFMLAIPLFLPWSNDYLAKYSQRATSEEFLVLTAFIWFVFGTINGICALLTRRFNRYFFIMNAALTAACFLNCIGTLII